MGVLANLLALWRVGVALVVSRDSMSALAKLSMK